MNTLSQSGRQAILVALAIPITSIFFNQDCLATTSPRPGAHAPEHVRQHAVRSQVSFDTPGAWRSKAKDAKKSRDDVAKRGGASNAVTGVLECPYSASDSTTPIFPPTRLQIYNRNSSTGHGRQARFPSTTSRSPTGSSRSMLMLSISEISHPTTPSTKRGSMDGVRHRSPMSTRR